MVGNLWEWVALWEGHPGDNGVDNIMVSDFGEDAYTAGGPSYSTMLPHHSDGSWRTFSPAFDGNGISLDDYFGPAAAIRGGNWENGADSGVFAMSLSSGPSSANGSYGARCCRSR